jgi:hypothetical protein
MNKETAKRVLELAKAAKADRWYVRRPTDEMKKHFGEQGLHPFIEQRRDKGEAVGVEVLAEDYSGDDDLREAHISFIMGAAENLAELAQFYLDYAEDVGAADPFEDDLNV